MGNPVKIQINSLEALERLIGGDSELEIELRQSVVELFTRKYLKPIAHDGLIEKTGKAIKEEIHNDIFKTIQDGTWSTKIVLSDKYAASINSYILETGNKLVEEALHKLYNIKNIDLQMTNLIARQTNHIIEVWTSGYIEEQIEIGVNNRLKEKLGL